MNINQLYNDIQSIKEIRPIGKNITVDGVFCHCMGMALRNDGTLHMLVLEYDEEYRGRAEEMEISEQYRDQEKHTYRSLRHLNENCSPALIFQETEAVHAGKHTWKVNIAESDICGDKQKMTVLFSMFIINNWDFSGLECFNSEYLFLIDLYLEGEFEKIPEIKNEDRVCFALRENSICHFAEIPVHLTIGENRTEMIFYDRKSGERHRAYINKTELCDMKKEMEKVFYSSEFKEKFSADEIAQCKEDFQERFGSTCEKDKRYCVVEYECEEHISLEFHSRQRLDAERESSSDAVGFLMKPNMEKGVSGMRVKAAVIQEPVNADTKSIDAELFCFYERIDSREFTI